MSQKEVRFLQEALDMIEEFQRTEITLGGASKISSPAEDEVGKEARRDRKASKKRSSPAEDEIGSMWDYEITVVKCKKQVHL